MADKELVFELDIDSEWTRVRRFREHQYEQAGIGEFLAFRLALNSDLDWHRVVRLKRSGASDAFLADQFID